jgi:hypothetical protein
MISIHDATSGPSSFTIHAFYDLFRTKKTVIPVWEDIPVPLIYLPDLLRSFDELMEAPAEKLTTRVYTLACLSVTAKEYGEQLHKLFPRPMLAMSLTIRRNR